MIRALRTFPLLDGFRGAPRADLAAVEDVVLRMPRSPPRIRRSPSSTAIR